MVVCVLLAFYINALKSYCAHNVKIAMENKPYENLRIFILTYCVNFFHIGIVSKMKPLALIIIVLVN